MKDKLIRYAPFQLYESTSFEEYLSKMSLKGWLIEKISGTDILTFRKTEKCNRLFTIDIFNEASVSDTPPEGKTADYVELCQAAGWEFLCGRGKMLIFASTNEHPVPIQTDYELKQKMISKEARRKISVSLINLLWLMSFFILVVKIMTFGSVISKYSTIFVLIGFFFLAMISLFLVIDFVVSLISIHTSRRAGRVIEYRGYCMRGKLRVRRGLNYGCISAIAAIFLSIYFESDIHVNAWIRAAVLVLVLGLWALIYLLVIKKQLKQIQKEFLIFTVVFLYMGSVFLMPLAANVVKKVVSGDDGYGITYDTGSQAEADAVVSIADWRESSDTDQQTFLASHKKTRFNYHDMNSGEDVVNAITVFSSSYNGVMDIYIELAQKASDMKRDDKWKDAWGADAVYFSSVNHFTKYLIVYKSTVLELQVYGTLSETHMKQFSARLRPASANQ